MPTYRPLKAPCSASAIGAGVGDVEGIGRRTSIMGSGFFRLCRNGGRTYAHERNLSRLSIDGSHILVGRAVGNGKTIGIDQRRSRKFSELIEVSLNGRGGVAEREAGRLENHAASAITRPLDVPDGDAVFILF